MSTPRRAEKTSISPAADKRMNAAIAAAAFALLGLRLGAAALRDLNDRAGLRR